MTWHSPAIGTAGWSIPKQHAPAFPSAGTHLERYAGRLPAVEINTSFYRPHRATTYERWAASVPPGFRFAVKIPKVITHERRLTDTEEPLARFLGEVCALGDRLGPLLLQLPPSLRYDAAVAEPFLSDLRTRFAGDVACEPRHASWFTEAVEAKLADLRIARVAADPAVVPEAAAPGGWPGLAYWRWHGSPEIYRSRYPAATLEELRGQIRSERDIGRRCWCIFDNTALGEATGNALELLGCL
ncbi:DUF72 domain-containing protein [Sabulicella glaciei]|uniref:DUF72 domain-containing protein n=1 Tax=Sabulicella glaciei TaxID=2984948 RepID=A0ABT3P227_9PROT|nr:DUF72 domain-containing protein [Roseococcus sp. MDT2-1-1]MCW8088468.1 DUF72 domain-containing protein [Roseococcus sp. MDT2-1-1]